MTSFRSQCQLQVDPTIPKMNPSAGHLAGWLSEGGSSVLSVPAVTLGSIGRYDWEEVCVGRVSPNKRIERSGVNALRSLLEEQGHLVHEIDGGADHGEDLFVSFVRKDRRTGHTIAVQVKAGKTYKRKNGYAIPVGDHGPDWSQSRIPVIGVVYDTAKKRLFWANLTSALTVDPYQNWVKLPVESELNDGTMAQFVIEIQRFIDKEKMKVYSDEEHLNDRIRTARAGIPLDPMKDSDAPNPIFDHLAALLVRYLNLGKQIKNLSYLFIVLSVMIFEWPLQNKFAAQYLPRISSWNWVVPMYLMILFLLAVIRSERKVNRRALVPMKLVFYVSWYYAFLPFQMGDGSGFDAIWGKIWVYIMLFLPGMVMPAVCGYYVAVEIRRRRVRA